jgi:hypothetical protein
MLIFHSWIVILLFSIGALPREAADLLRKVQSRARTRFGTALGGARVGGEGGVGGAAEAHGHVLSSTDELLGKNSQKCPRY